jgi:hypothetical protein
MRVTINDDTINIDLRATRGAQGNTAVIYINEDMPDSKAKTVRKPRAATATASTSDGAPRKRGRPSKAEIAAREAQAAGATETSSETAETASESEEQVTAVSEAEDQVSATSEAPESSEDVSEEVSEEASQTEQVPAAPRPSLFGGIKTPENAS